MMLHREIKDQKLGFFLQETDEGILLDLMEDRKADEEVSAAIQHSINIEGYQSRPISALLGELRKEKRI